MRCLNCLICSLLIAIIFIFGSPCAAKDERKDHVRDRVIVKAPCKFVWDAIVSVDEFDCSIQGGTEQEAVVEQEIKSIPFMGTAKVVFKAQIKPQEQIDFSMVKSDKLKDMRGAWRLKSIGYDKTEVELRSYVDPGIPVPRFLINKFVKGRVAKRLKATKVLAEQNYNKHRG